MKSIFYLNIFFLKSIIIEIIAKNFFCSVSAMLKDRFLPKSYSLDRAITPNYHLHIDLSKKTH